MASIMVLAFEFLYSKKIGKLFFILLLKYMSKVADVISLKETESSSAQVSSIPIASLITKILLFFLPILQAVLFFHSLNRV